MPPKPATPPFFHQRATHKLVDELSNLKNVVLYVGAGSSVERTGLTWTGLTAQLMDPSFGSFGERVELIRTMSPLGVSSVVAEQFKATDGDGWRERLSDSMRRQLYRGSSELQSYFNERVAALANDYLVREKRAAIVTPNYDTFLLDAARSLKTTDFEVKEFVFGVPRDDMKITKAQSVQHMDDLMELLAMSVEDAKILCVVHLHGLVERDSEPSDAARWVHPVVSEADYADTRERSRAVLKLLFKGRDALILGSSITDPPLIHALLETKPAPGLNGRVPSGSPRRYAIQPKQGRDLGAFSGQHKNVDRAEKDRGNHLGLRMVAPDYFFQAPQLLEEIRADLALENEHLNYSDPDSEYRYGQRLNAWWRAWFHKPGTLIERQMVAHTLLKDSLAVIRGIIEADPDEDLRLEAWVRWRPDERRLNLFASSVGTWPDFETMRSDFIRADSDYSSTKAFTFGAPLYTSGGESRWKSFIAKPIRYTDKKSHVVIPVGVLSLASMRSQEDSALGPNHQNYAAALMAYLDSVGGMLMEAGERDEEISDGVGEEEASAD